MKIVLASLNSKYIHSSIAPWYIKSGIEQFCSQQHEVTVIKNTINEPAEKILSGLVAATPDIIGFSCYIWNIDAVLELSGKIKKLLNTTVILGGPEVQYRADQILKDYNHVDYVVKGEGEWSFSSLVDCISSNCGYENSEGLCYRAGNDIISNPEEYHAVTPPSPYSNEFFKQLNGRIAYIEASRGCPFNCAYCLSGRLGKMRYFDLDYVFTNIINLSASGSKIIKFIDRTFNADEDKAVSILEFIRNNYGKSINKNICFHFEFTADIIGNKMLNVLRTMPVGLVQLEIGIQSFNEATLKSINRKSDINKLKENVIKLLKLKNIHIHIDLIAGLPYESYDSFRDSFNQAYSIKANMLQLGFLKLLYGSPMYEMRSHFDYRFADTPPYKIISNAFIKGEEIAKLKACENALDRLYNNGRFLMTLNYLFEELHLNPFDSFVAFGMSADFNKMSLKDFVSQFYNHFSEKSDPEILREVILCDLASIPVNINPPDCLFVYDKNYKRLKKHYSELLQKKVRIVILNSSNQVFVAHPDIKDTLNNRYYTEKYDLAFSNL